MTPTDGRCRIDGLDLCETSMNLLGPVPVITAKLAFVDSSSGARVGYTQRNSGWSEETMQRLAALVSSMEQDVLREVFLAGTATPGVPEQDAPLAGVVSSL